MKLDKKIIRTLFFLLLLFLIQVKGSSAVSDTIRVLFIGNSYIYVNDLPSLLKEVASSDGKVIISEQDTPGGSTLEGHWKSEIPQKLIKEGGWNYMILQEHSQRPSMPIESVNQLVFPFVHNLDSLFKAFNPTGKTIFYMTWGRKNGDSSRCKELPLVCTYQGMDDLTRERYLMMSEQNKALISPVGVVWRHLRETNPEIELYMSDESHPSINGSYAGALCFYTVITQKDPTLISFNSTIDPTMANIIKMAVKKVVYEHLDQWNIGRY